MRLLQKKDQLKSTLNSNFKNGDIIFINGIDKKVAYYEISKRIKGNINQIFSFELIEENCIETLNQTTN